ncbi:MAG: hypothetical protein KKH29_02730 [Candidatus Omnitrophica bacterium]|nr:hypothetical protein [Candidatus Omnitrophota bacterium]MCG2707033.1 hypothetical protein [Candidatus Omnitrophota bacterium]
MWLATTSIAAVGVTLTKFVLPKDYRLDFLALMLWGAAVMILIDHILGYEGGEFLEKITDGMIKNGVVLGIAMLLPVFIIWGISLLILNLKRR